MSNKPQVYAVDGVIPVIDPSSYVHPSAVIIGDVVIGKDCYIGPLACLRGDFGRIRIGDAVNVQETCVLHSFPGQDCRLADRSHIGHGAVLHGCELHENVLIGMNAVVMDGVVIERDCIVGALSFLKAKLHIPSRSMVVGNPAKVLRELSDEEIDWKSSGTEVYRQLAIGAPQSWEVCDALSEMPDSPGRTKLSTTAINPKR